MTIKRLSEILSRLAVHSPEANVVIGCTDENGWDVIASIDEVTAAYGEDECVVVKLIQGGIK
jgi:hypothetical protein